MYAVYHIRLHRSGKLFRSKLLNTLFGPLYTAIDSTFAIEPGDWIDSHMGSHHLYTNDAAEDSDVAELFPALRLSPRQEHYWFHRYQTFYVPLVLSFTLLVMPFWNMRAVFDKDKSVWSKVKRSLYFVAFLQIVVFVPWHSRGMRGLLMVLVEMMVAGVFTGYLFQVSHNHQVQIMNLSNTCQLI
jgi:linoleoyl-CoA desaturase